MKEIEYFCKNCGKRKENHVGVRLWCCCEDRRDNIWTIFNPEDNFDVIKRLRDERNRILV
ncbi:MAG: hypothetical protein ACREBJ_06480 [Nitrosotalea sp.]